MATINTLDALESTETFELAVLSTLKTVGRDLEWLLTVEVNMGEGGVGTLVARTSPNFDDQLFGVVRTYESLVRRMVSSGTQVERDLVVDDVPDLLSMHSLLLESAREYGRDDREYLTAVDAQLVMARTALNSFELWRRTANAVTRVETAADLAEEAADAAAESAGDTASVSLSEEFDGLARSENRVGNIFRGLTIAFLVAAAIYSGAIAFAAETPTVELAQKLAVALPILLFAGYFTRESRQHRQTAQWASVLGAQLRSLRAFTASLPSDQAATLRFELGRRVFLSAPDGGSRPETDAASAEKVSEILDRLSQARHQSPNQV